MLFIHFIVLDFLSPPAESLEKTELATDGGDAKGNKDSTRDEVDGLLILERRILLLGHPVCVDEIGTESDRKEGKEAGACGLNNHEREGCHRGRHGADKVLEIRHYLRMCVFKNLGYGFISIF